MSFLPRWDCENENCFTHAQSNNRLLRLKCLNLPYNREFRETVDVDTALLQNDDALFAHPYALNFSIKVELFELLHLLVVPHDDFCFGPLGVLASAYECHYVLCVEDFNDAYAAVELSRQMQLNRITLINLEARLCANSDAALILIETEENDLITIVCLVLGILLGGCAIVVVSVEPATTVIIIVHTCVIRNTCHRLWVLIELGLMRE